MSITRLKIEEIVNTDEIPLLYNLECPIDNMVTLNPLICQKCETVFCSECIEIWKRSNNDCPTCRNKPFINFSLDSHFLKTQISKILTRCSNHRFGCKDVVKVSNLKVNGEYCQFNQVNCYKCSSVFAAGYQLKHFASECEHFQLDCIFCGSKFSLQTVVEHTLTCFREFEKLVCRHCLKKHPDSFCEDSVVTCNACGLPEIAGNIVRKTHCCKTDPIATADHVRKTFTLVAKQQEKFNVEVEKAFRKFAEEFEKKKFEFEKKSHEFIVKLEGFYSELTKEERSYNKRSVNEKHYKLEKIRRENNKIENEIKGKIFKTYHIDVDQQIENLEKEHFKELDRHQFEFSKQVLVSQNELAMSKYLLEAMAFQESNIMNEELRGNFSQNLIQNDNSGSTNKVSSVLNSFLNTSSNANLSCQNCNKHIDNSGTFKCEKCFHAVCENCRFFCKNEDLSHKNVFCKKCSVSCVLCGNSEFCLKCVKTCKGKKCENVLCVNCHKPNSHLFYENCNTIRCKDCDKKTLCILTTFFCSNCNERYCKICFDKAHRHKMNK